MGRRIETSGLDEVYQAAIAGFADILVGRGYASGIFVRSWWPKLDHSRDRFEVFSKMNWNQFESGSHRSLSGTVSR